MKEKNKKNDLVLEAAQLSLKKTRNKFLYPQDEKRLSDILSELGMSLEETLKEAEKILLIN